MSDKIPDLKAIITAVDAVIDQLIAEKVSIQEPINWADLSCREALFCIDQDGDSFVQVTIEEASPACPIFCRELYARLEKQGITNLRIMTEW